MNALIFVQNKYSKQRGQRVVWAYTFAGGVPLFNPTWSRRPFTITWLHVCVRAVDASEHGGRERREAELDWSGRQSPAARTRTHFSLWRVYKPPFSNSSRASAARRSERSSTEYCHNFCQVRVAENAACMRIVYVQRFRALVARVSWPRCKLWLNPTMRGFYLNVWAV